MRIAQLADKYHVDKRTIDYYTKTVNILPCTTLPNSSYRDYDNKSEEVLIKILVLKESGLSIDEIKRTLDNPSYFTGDKWGEHIRTLEKNRDEAITRYDSMIRCSRAMKDTAMAPLKMVEVYQEIPSITLLTQAFASVFEKVTDESNPILSSDETAELSDLIVAFLANLQKRKEQGFDSSEIQEMVSRFRSRLDKYIGVVLYFGFSCFIEIKGDVFGIDDECGDGTSDIMKKMLRICSDWFLSAKTIDKINDFKSFQENFKDEIHAFDEEIGESSYDSFVEVIQGICLECRNSSIILKSIVEGIKASNAVNNAIDAEYGEGFMKFLSDAVDFYINCHPDAAVGNS